jgi:hypothetical protein
LPGGQTEYGLDAEPFHGGRIKLARGEQSLHAGISREKRGAIERHISL